MIAPTETLIRLNEVPKHLPNRGQKPLNITTVYRWVQKGLNGIRLESCYVAGIHHTSIEALRRFDEAVTAAKLGASPAVVSKPAQSSRAHEAAKRKLASA